MYCENCGSALKDSAKFCPVCGAHVGGTSANDQESTVRSEELEDNSPIESSSGAASESSALSGLDSATESSITAKPSTTVGSQSPKTTEPVPSRATEPDSTARSISLEVAGAGIAAEPDAPAGSASSSATKPAPSVVVEPDTAAGLTPFAATKKNAPKASKKFSEQIESDRQRSRKKLSPLMILVLVLCLLAGTALAAVLITQQAGEKTNSVNSGQPSIEAPAPSAPASEAAPEPEPEPEPAAQQTWIPEQGHYEDVYETVHVPAVTHEEPIYTTVVDQEAWTETKIGFVEMGENGPLFNSREEADAYMVANGFNGALRYVTVQHEAVTHQEQTGTTTVVDVPAHDEQQVVGSTWVVDVPGHWE